MDSLYQLKPGQKATIESYQDFDLASRLMSMGVMPGLEVEFIRQSLSGAACIVKINALTLALRKVEAQKIQVKR